ncbi:Uma2 family endonuclease [Roseofilum sp. BLCC_M114]|uniref:Uma2 family endonuclease n=1 Tax=Roseofilum capinflatum BLCC-M114 TaxID=3022440 RepID=A0ABT7B6G6_9CYAN|nr:Uma2 family endonuclease [Roseofilum capinflatum]MDJ1174766.1 Uma2 family endonuclease [Roseofilum capinflatum BLCC-M114]
MAASSVSIDLHQKRNIYRRNQVQEYLVWRVDDGELDWFRLENEEDIKLEPNADGIIESQIFPGLWLNQAALFAGDLAQVLATLQTGLATPEHQSFVNP